MSVECSTTEEEVEQEEEEEVQLQVLEIGSVGYNMTALLSQRSSLEVEA